MLILAVPKDKSNVSTAAPCLKDLDLVCESICESSIFKNYFSYLNTAVGWSMVIKSMYYQPILTMVTYRSSSTRGSLHEDYS